MLQMLHGRKVVYINGRYFAVDKDIDRAQRIACATRSTGPMFERVQQSARNNSNKHVFKK